MANKITPAGSKSVKPATNMPAHKGQAPAHKMGTTMHKVGCKGLNCGC